MFFSYKLIPVAENSFDEYLANPGSYSKKALATHVKEQMLARDVAVDLSTLTFTIKEGHLYGEGVGFATK